MRASVLVDLRGARVSVEDLVKEISLLLGSMQHIRLFIIFSTLNFDLVHYDDQLVLQLQNFKILCILFFTR